MTQDIYIPKKFHTLYKYRVWEEIMISEKSMKLIRKMQQNELNESIIYRNVAKFVKDEKNKETLQRFFTK